MKKMSKGFTLIELLVVISIIAILVSLSLVSFSGAQKQARDTQRRSDLNQFRIALENYAASNGTLYPSGGCVDVALLCSNSAFSTFISFCLTDPSGTPRHYRYCSSVSGSTIGGPTASKYLLYTSAGTSSTFDPLETGGIWVVCFDGRARKVTPATWNAISAFCPM